MSEARRGHPGAAFGALVVLVVLAWLLAGCHKGSTEPWECGKPVVTIDSTSGDTLLAGRLCHRRW